MVLGFCSVVCTETGCGYLAIDDAGNEYMSGSRVHSPHVLQRLLVNSLADIEDSSPDDREHDSQSVLSVSLIVGLKAILNMVHYMYMHTAHVCMQLNRRKKNGQTIYVTGLVFRVERDVSIGRYGRYSGRYIDLMSVV